jgi:hypothetical protein
MAPLHRPLESTARRSAYGGQLVLHVETGDREILIRKENGRYWTYCSVGWGLSRWTRLAAGRDTVREARGLALWILREPFEETRPATSPDRASGDTMASMLRSGITLACVSGPPGPASSIVTRDSHRKFVGEPPTC